MNTTDVLATYRRHGAPYQTNPLQNRVVSRAVAATLHCADGQVLIDLASGDFGHGHPVVKAAVIAQVLRGPLSSRVLINRGLAELSIQLAEWTPGDLEVSYICNSGEEALDSALKLAKGRWPKRKSVVVCTGADYGTLSHGVRFAGIGERFLPTLAFSPVPLQFGDADVMATAIDRDTAAVVLEPFDLGAGNLAASARFWETVRRRCHEVGALLIVSELRTGLGRSGRRFGIGYSGIEPDVLVTGGALGGGHISIGAYITTKQINDHVYGRRNPTLHGSTTGANPCACAAALAALRVIEDEWVSARQTQFGALASRAAAACGAASRVQAQGSLVAIDFADHETARQVQTSALESGLLLRAPDNGRIVLYPPLTLSDAERETSVALLMSAIGQVCFPGVTPVDLSELMP